jgi:hypothetical protein
MHPEEVSPVNILLFTRVQHTTNTIKLTRQFRSQSSILKEPLAPRFATRILLAGSFDAMSDPDRLAPDDQEPAAKRRCLVQTKETDEANKGYSRETGANKKPTEEETKPLSKHLLGFQQLPRSVELEILEWLRHKGSLACTSIAANAIIQEANDGQVCCPSQQFHHPADGDLINVSEFDEPLLHPIDNRMTLKFQEIEDEREDEREDDWMGLSRSEFKRKQNQLAKRDLKWSCCGSDFFSTGCTTNTGVTLEEAETAMEANERAQSNAYEDDTCDSAYSNRDWDESIGEDAKPNCTCGYADGVYSYCAC